MIEINLMEVKKPLRLPIFMGIDLNELNFKFLILFYILSLAPEHFYYPQFDEMIAAKKAEQMKIKKELQKIQREGRGKENIRRQIEAFVSQEKKLEAKLDVVRSIIKQKQNPRDIMLYITKNIPNDVWLKKVEIKGKDVLIEGGSSSYRNIGVFIENLRNSVFFDSSLHLKGSKTEEDKDGYRTESFEVEGKIKKFR